jgi:hypothetical protein
VAAAGGQSGGRVLRLFSLIDHPDCRKDESRSLFYFVGLISYSLDAMKCPFVLSFGFQPASLSLSTIWVGLPGLKGTYSILEKGCPTVYSDKSDMCRR